MISFDQAWHGIPVEKIQELQANHRENKGDFYRFSSKYRPIFTALKIQSKIVILQEIQEFQAAVPCLLDSVLNQD